MKTVGGMKVRGITALMLLAVFIIFGPAGAGIAWGADELLGQVELAALWNLDGMPDGLAVGPDGSVYVTINNNHRLVGYTAGGEKFTEWSYEGQVSGMDVSPDGTVFVTITNNHREIESIYSPPQVIGYRPTGEAVAQWPVECAGCVEPEPAGLAVGPDGTVFVTINNNHRAVGYAVGGGQTAGWSYEGEAAGLAVGPEGTIFVTINNNHRVVGYTAGGEQTAEWSYEGEASGLAVSPSGQVWVTINNNHRAVGYTAQGEQTAEWSYEGETVGLAIGPEGRFHLADPSAQAIRVYAFP